MNFEISRQLNNFVTCTVEGLNYVATSKDNSVIRNMYIQRLNHAVNEMKIFHDLAQKYYNVDDSEGYFFDLGANIGTTGIYFTRKIAPNLKLLAFEPDTENFKLLRTNLILNDMGDITAQEVKYIWIDTEGFEPQVLLGAKNLLRENPAPIFMEFNPMVWNKSGFYEQMMKLLKDCRYTHYILIREFEQTNEEKIHQIEDLWNFTKSTAWIGSLGDIFLIRKGAIV